MNRTIPLIDLKAQYKQIKSEINQSIEVVLEKANFIGGDDIQFFESNFAGLHKLPHCIGVGNGTDSLTLIWKALDLSIGSDVFVPANSFIASSESVTLANHHVVFVDCDKYTYNIDPVDLERKIRNSKKPGAILVVHLFGRPADMDSLQSLSEKYSIPIVEDCAQAHLAEYRGQKVGTFGIAASFSFYPGKNLGAFGDAGAVITSDKKISEKIRKLANHGRLEKYNHEIEGTNSRLDTIQAAILNVKLKYLNQWTEKRIEIAKRYNELFEGSDIITSTIANDFKHVFHLYVVRIKNRDHIKQKLNESGIQTGIHYPIALPFLRAYSHMNAKPDDFPNSYQNQTEILSLPIFPELSEESQEFIINKLLEELKNV